MESKKNVDENADENAEEIIEEDLKLEEDTSKGAGQPESNEADSEEDTSINEEEAEEKKEESIDELKVRLAKAESDLGNYRQGLISEKAKKRTLVTQNVEQDSKEVVANTDIQKQNEQIVLSVLEKQNERKVLRDVINPKSEVFIPELVDDNQYNEIIGYLPRNLDKLNQSSIVRALKIATKLWKEENGIQEKKPDKAVVVRSNLAAGKATSSSGKQAPTKGGLKILKKSVPVSEWYT